MIRWKYVVPRVLALLTVTVVLCFSLGPLLYFTIVYGGQAATGARVELQKVSVDLAKAQVCLTGLRVADPERQQQNLFEAETIFLDVETESVLRRKLVVREGRVSGLRLQSGRDESGALEESGDDESGASIVEHAKQRGEAWLDSSIDTLQQDLESELHTVRLSRELRQRWPVEYERLRLRGKQIENEAQKLKDDVQSISERPLENLPLIQPTLARVEQLRRDLTETRQQLDRLKRQVDLDRGAIAQAKEHDAAYLRDKLHIDLLDADSLNDYLLGPVWSERLKTAFYWIQYSRELTADDSSDAPLTRGLNVVFPGYHATPDILVRRLLLDGAGTANGTPFEFKGQIADLTHQATRHSRPTTVQIQSTGGIDLVAEATLDRRQEVAEDRYVVDIPAMQQAGQMLGDPNRLAVEIAPGTATIHADVQVIDQELQGWITIDQKQVDLTPHLGPKYSKYLTGDRLHALGGINEFGARISVSGPIQLPRWRLQSDLGVQLATALNTAVQEELNERQRQLLQQGNQIVERELNELQQDLMSEHRQLLKRLEIGDEQLDLLKKQLMAKAGSSEQIIGQGRKLLEMLK